MFRCCFFLILCCAVEATFLDHGRSSLLADECTGDAQEQCDCKASAPCNCTGVQATCNCNKNGATDCTCFEAQTTCRCSKDKPCVCTGPLTQCFCTSTPLDGSTSSGDSSSCQCEGPNSVCHCAPGKPCSCSGPNSACLCGDASSCECTGANSECVYEKGKAETCTATGSNSACISREQMNWRARIEGTVIVVAALIFVGCCCQPGCLCYAPFQANSSGTLAETDPKAVLTEAKAIIEAAEAAAAKEGGVGIVVCVNQGSKCITVDEGGVDGWQRGAAAKKAAAVISRGNTASQLTGPPSCCCGVCCGLPRVMCCLLPQSFCTGKFYVKGAVICTTPGGILVVSTAGANSAVDDLSWSEKAITGAGFVQNPESEVFGGTVLA